MGKKKRAEEICDELDAAIFSGDAFYNEKALDVLEIFIGRWTRESERIKTFLKEEENHGEDIQEEDET